MEPTRAGGWSVKETSNRTINPAIQVTPGSSDWTTTEREYERAKELSPGDALIQQNYGWCLGLMGRFDESLSELKRAQALDPLSTNINIAIGSDYYWSDFYSWLRFVLESRSRTQVFSTEFLVANMGELLDSGRLLLVLDSLDEMPPSSFTDRCDHLSAFMLRYTRNAFVVTCRSNDFAGAIKDMAIIVAPKGAIPNTQQHAE